LVRPEVRCFAPSASLRLGFCDRKRTPLVVGAFANCVSIELDMATRADEIDRQIDEYLIDAQEREKNPM